MGMPITSCQFGNTKLSMIIVTNLLVRDTVDTIVHNSEVFNIHIAIRLLLKWK